MLDGLDGGRHELGLAAGPMGRDHHLPGDRVGHIGPVVAADDVEAEVEAGRASGRGQNVAVVEVQHPRVDVDCGIPLGELGGMGPVGGGPPAVEQSGGGQHEGSCAQRQDAGPPGVGGPEGRQGLR